MLTTVTPGRAAVQHAQQGRDAPEGGAVAHAGGHGDHRTRHQPADHRGERPLHPGHHDHHGGGARGARRPRASGGCPPLRRPPAAPPGSRGRAASPRPPRRPGGRSCPAATTSTVPRVWRRARLPGREVERCGRAALCSTAGKALPRGVRGARGRRASRGTPRRGRRSARRSPTSCSGRLPLPEDHLRVSLPERRGGGRPARCRCPPPGPRPAGARPRRRRGRPLATSARRAREALGRHAASSASPRLVLFQQRLRLLQAGDGEELLAQRAARSEAPSCTNPRCFRNSIIAFSSSRSKAIARRACSRTIRKRSSTPGSGGTGPAVQRRARLPEDPGCPVRAAGDHDARRTRCGRASGRRPRPVQTSPLPITGMSSASHHRARSRPSSRCRCTSGCACGRGA